jgi:hypothetical protein
MEVGCPDMKRCVIWAGRQEVQPRNCVEINGQEKQWATVQLHESRRDNTTKRAIDSRGSRGLKDDNNDMKVDLEQIQCCECDWDEKYAA